MAINTQDRRATMYDEHGNRNKVHDLARDRQLYHYNKDRINERRRARYNPERQAEYRRRYQAKLAAEAEIMFADPRLAALVDRLRAIC